MTNMQSTLRHHADFKRLWAAQAVSAFGSRVTRTLLPILAIVTIGAGPGEISILVALSVAPGALIGLTMGGTVDRSRKRPLLIGADLVRAFLLATVPLAAWFDLLTMVQLYLVAAIVGAATALFEIADNAYLPALIGKSDLVEGNSKLEITDAVAEVGGPTLAGILIELVTAPFAILFDTASYIVSALFLGAIQKEEIPHEPETENPSLRRDIVIGLKASLDHPLVRPLFFLVVVGNIFNGFFFALYMLFAIDTLGVSPGAIGVIIGLGGIGALFGAMLGRWLPSKIGLGWAMILLMGSGQALCLLVPLATGPDWLIVLFLGAHQLIGDGLLVAYFVLHVSLRQTVLRQHVLGRANAAVGAAVGILVPASTLFAGWLATQIDIRTAMWIGVLFGQLPAVILLFSPIRTLKEMPIADE